jgi:hypothetical protein
LHDDQSNHRLTLSHVAQVVMTYFVVFDGNKGLMKADTHCSAVNSHYRPSTPRQCLR